ncbi:MAG TPA: alpha/beta fold hydrolase [Anaerolineae bacterium]|nr:alpha/beta fold hydrolase [Anaerolineae bacterium]
MKVPKLTLFFLLALLLVACDGQADDPTATAAQSPAAQSPAAQSPAESEAEPAEPPAAESSPPESDSTEAEEPAATEAPPAQPPAEPESQPPEPQDVNFEGADGLAIQGTFYPGSGEGPRPGVILLHMNGGNRGDWDAFARQLANDGYATLAVDMRAHGETGGARNWDLAADDLLRVWAAMAEREDVDGARTAVVGASIGANMALMTGAEEPGIKTVVLLSPGRDYFGVTTEDRIVEYGQRPALIIASEEDSEAAVSSRALHELADDAELIMYEGAGHGTRMFGPRPELAQEIVDWLNLHVQDGSAGGSGTVATVSDAGNAQYFDLDWDDRSAFRQGLIAAEGAVLEQLPGASVYRIDLSIAPDLQSVTGEQEIYYTNQEDVALNEVFFHLFPNLLGGSVTVPGVTVDGQSLEPEFRAQSTIMGVPLPAPLAPGESVILGMTFDVDVPTEGGTNYGVFATVDDVLALAHFYPQIAVYDDEGWNIDVPPPNADVTYGDSGFYLVRITAPAEQVIVSSGSQLSHSTEGDEQTLVVAAGPARDFYLASSDRYTVVSQQVGETTVNSYGFPEFITQNKQALGYAVGALESMGARLGPYPYTEFDVAPTPNLALGVEYPGATVIRAELYDPALELRDIPANALMESTVAHEVGHQWFYSTVGNDQLDEPWLDESLTQYVTYLYFLDTYGAQAAEGFRQSFVGRWDRVGMADIPIGMPAGNYDGTEYGAIVYGRGPLFFERLAEEMGQQTFDDFLRDYYQQNKWGIASGADLKSLAETHCDCDLTPLFAQWVGEQ